MVKWTSYATKFGREYDFEVRYRLFDREEGGRDPPYQGYRSDWEYADIDDPDEIGQQQIYGILPEFEDSSGAAYPAGKPVPVSGTAKMWITFDHMRPIHAARIHVGTRGYFREGRRRIGECVVTRVGGLRRTVAD